jgi:GT2 family glycosyltransferase/2-phospho-L-lactate transferase/gluconeogenesis factor (CofD/UPF0052 family)
MTNPLLPAKGLTVAILCGGSGSRGLANELMDYGAHVTCVVNAYDDGKSTGRLRRMFGVLGPSDLRKNLLSLMDPDAPGYWSLHEMFGYRFPVDAEAGPAFRREVEDICANGGSLARGERRELSRMAARLPDGKREPLVGYLRAFRGELVRREEEAGTSFSFSDCAIGNCILIGAYLTHERCWNRALDAIQALLCTRGCVELASVENRYLFGVCWDGRVLASEWEVITESDGDIAQLFLGEQPIQRQIAECRTVEQDFEVGLEQIRKKFHSPAAPNPRVLQTLAAADVIVYGPGTFHSSLLPTLMVDGIADALRESRASKILVTNIVEEADTRGYTCADIARAVFRCLGEQGCNHLIVNEPKQSRGKEHHSPHGADALAPMVNVVLCDLEDRAIPGRHRASLLAKTMLRLTAPDRVAAVPVRHEPLVSIVMLAWNRKDEVEIGLSELRNCSYPNLEVIVVDNGSQDGTAQMIYETFPEVTVIRMPKNDGMNGYNVGFATARGKYVIMLDDDSHPAPDSVETMVRIWEEDSEGRIGAMAFRLINPQLGSLISHLWEERLCDTELGREREITSFGACGAAIRRSVLDEVGFFDDRFFVYGTEDDLAIRIWSAGYKIVYEPRCSAYHRESGKNRSWKRYGRGFRNAAWFNLKHLPWHFLPQVIARNVFWLLVRSIRFRSGAFFIHGLLGYLQGYLQCWIPLSRRRVVTPDIARFCLDDDWISRPILRTVHKVIATKRYILEKRGVTPGLGG